MVVQTIAAQALFGAAIRTITIDEVLLFFTLGHHYSPVSFYCNASSIKTGQSN
jgi:hypothetical protein